MKTLTVQVGKRELSHLMAEAHPGDVIVLTDGNRRMTVEASVDLEADSAELGAELLKAAKGPFTPYSRGDLEAVAEKVRREKRRS
ncbi:MAG: hypothetical protein AB1705_18590 [Verrucomicrobiota bacterium]